MEAVIYVLRLISYLVIPLLPFLSVGCQQQETGEEKVVIYVLHADQSPVQNFIVALSETGESTPDIGFRLEPTDKDGKTETTLKVGATYEAYLVKDDGTTQYETFTVSRNAEKNVFTFVLEE